MNTLKIVLVQADLIWENPEANLTKFDSLLTQIPLGVDVIILPEMFTTGFSMNSEMLAESMNDRSIDWMRKKSSEHNTAIVGSIIIREDDCIYNRLVWMNSDGSHISYDKKHLFGLAHEDEHYAAGNNRIVIEYKGWKICPLICYDLRFPEWGRNTDNFDILLYVANWPITRAEHWRTLLRARAIENQCYVIGVNRVGNDGNGLNYAGHSSVYDYEGTKVVEEIGEEKVMYLELKKKPLLDYRLKLPFLKDQSLSRLKTKITN